MLQFFSSLFSNTQEQSGVLDDALVKKATDRVLAGTDRRLFALSDYQQRLREPVEQSILHAIALVDRLPTVKDISLGSYGADPLLRAVFASPDHLREVLRGFDVRRDSVKLDGDGLSEHYYAMMMLQREERNVLAMELHGDAIQRDVMRVAVNFSSHRFVAVTQTESDTRWELKKRAFDYLIEKALSRLIDGRGKRFELDRQRSLLKRKLDAMQSGDWGLGAVLNESINRQSSIPKLEAEIEAIEVELGQSLGDKLSLEDSLDLIADTLSRPSDWLDSRETLLRLDYRGIITPESSTTSANELSMCELFSDSGQFRIAMLTRILKNDIPEPINCWENAKHYLA